MKEQNTQKNNLQNMADLALNLRSRMTMDRLTAVFRDISMLEYSLLMRLWPALETDLAAECPPRYLRDMESVSKLPMHQISSMVKHLQNSGYVLWEHDETGTYILPSEHGLETLATQRQVLLDFFDQVISKLGEEKFMQIQATLEEFENAINEVIIN